MANISRFFWAAATAIILFVLCFGFFRFENSKIYTKCLHFEYYLAALVSGLFCFIFFFCLVKLNKHSKCVLRHFHCLSDSPGGIDDYAPGTATVCVQNFELKAWNTTRIVLIKRGFSLSFFTCENYSTGSCERCIFILSALDFITTNRAANYLDHRRLAQVFRANVSESMHAPESLAST